MKTRGGSVWVSDAKIVLMSFSNLKLTYIWGTVSLLWKSSKTIIEIVKINGGNYGIIIQRQFYIGGLPPAPDTQSEGTFQGEQGKARRWNKDTGLKSRCRSSFSMSGAFRDLRFYLMSQGAWQ